MAVPDRLLIHDLVVVAPAGVGHSVYGTSWDYGASATRSTIRGWMEQVKAEEEVTESRDLLAQEWKLITNASGIDANHRIEWPAHPAGTAIFTVEGPPEPAYTPRGRHHMQVRLRKVEG